MPLLAPVRAAAPHRTALSDGSRVSTAFRLVTLSSARCLRPQAIIVRGHHGWLLSPTTEISATESSGAVTFTTSVPTDVPNPTSPFGLDSAGLSRGLILYFTSVSEFEIEFRCA